MTSGSGRILITGGGGMVGRALRSHLPDAIFLTRAECDLEDRAAVADTFRRHSPDIVIHLAALVGGIQDNVSRPWDYTVRNTLINTHTVSSALEAGVTYFVGVSSTCAYPDVVAQYPMTEDQLHLGPPAQENLPYGYTKRMMAIALEAAAKQHGMASAVLYPCNLYGPWDSFDLRKSHLVAALIRKIHGAKVDNAAELPMLGTGRPLRQFMYADDLARAITIFVEQRPTGNFNIATPENLTVDAIAEVVQEVIGLPVPRKYSGTLDGQYRKDASSAKFLSVCPDFAFTPLAEGVRKTYDWYLKNL